MKLKTTRFFRNVITVVFTLIISPSIIAQVIDNVVYDENIDGDLSLDNNAPTVITFAPGDNRIVSTQMQTVDQANFFTFQIPEGYELSQLIVDSFEGSDNLGFIGIDEGSSISITPPAFIGGLSYGTVHIDTDILPAMGDESNPAAIAISGFGFTPPLANATYTVWLNQTGNNSSSVLNFVVSADDTNLSVTDNQIQDGVVLKQNYPNPFNRTTTIEYRLSNVSAVTLDIYNMQGQLVKSLNNGVQSSGNHAVTFDMDNMNDGVYIPVLVTEKGSKKLLVVLKN